jgi:hypothetical protein
MAVPNRFIPSDANILHTMQRDPMSQNVTLIESNNAEFPSGSRVWGREEQGMLWALAGYDVEDIIYNAATHQVTVRTALGYHFTISTTDYHLIVAE